MTTNAQAALIAAASLPVDPNSISYGNVGATMNNANAFKAWLDQKDQEQVYLDEAKAQSDAKP